jgi:hypothetical protein
MSYYMYREHVETLRGEDADQRPSPLPLFMASGEN